MAAGRDLIFTILGIDKGSEAFKKVSASADEAGSRIDRYGKTSLLALASTVTAATGAGLAVGGALAGTAIAFGAFGVAVASSNDAVAQSYGDMWETIKTETQQDAATLAPVLLDISNQTGAAFQELRPQLRAMFQDSAPAIQALTAGVLGFTKEALPGLERAVQHSDGPMQGLRDLMISTGQGVTLFFDHLDTGSESSGKILQHLGDMIKNTLGFAGTMFAKLSNDGEPAVNRLDSVFSQLLNTIDQLSSGALPILSSAVGAGLSVLSGLASIVGDLSGVLGPLIGIAVSAAAALKLIDTVTFGGVSGQLAGLKKSITEAEGFGGKLKAGVGGLASGIGLMGAAAGTAGLVLSFLGEQQQIAAEKAAKHAQNVDDLAKALRDSNGVINDNIRNLAATALQNTEVFRGGKNVLQVARELGVSLPLLTDGYLGNAAAQQAVNEQLDALIEAGTTYEETNSGQNKIQTDSAQAAEYLKRALADTNKTSAEAVQKRKDLQAAEEEAAIATSHHASELERLQNLMLQSVDKNLAYRSSVEAEKKAQQEAADAIKQHGASSDEAVQANLSLEQSMVRSVNAAGELAKANYRGKDAEEAARLQVEATNKEILRLAQLSGENAPAALRQMIGGMDATQLAALGATVKVNKLGQTVVTLPNGKTITLTAEDLASLPMQNIYRTWNGKVITWTLNMRPSPGSAANFRMVEEMTQGRASGGPVKAGVPYIVGESGPELIFPAVDGFVATAGETRRMMAGGGAGTQVALGSSAGGSPIVIEIRSGGSPWDDVMVQALTKAIRVRGGNVQAVLGS